MGIGEIKDIGLAVWMKMSIPNASQLILDSGMLSVSLLNAIKSRVLAGIVEAGVLIMGQRRTGIAAIKKILKVFARMILKSSLGTERGEAIFNLRRV